MNDTGLVKDTRISTDPKTLGIELKQHIDQSVGELMQRHAGSKHLSVKKDEQDQLLRATRKKKKKPSTLMNGLIKRI